MDAAGDDADQLGPGSVKRQQQAEVRDGLARLVSKLNPSAEEFVPSSRHPRPPAAASCLSVSAPVFVATERWDGAPVDAADVSSNDVLPRRRKSNFKQRRRINHRIERAQKGDSIRRTVYVSDVAQHVTEEQLALVFSSCGNVLDCRICGDPNSPLRFAFVEYANDNSAAGALELDGTAIGNHPVRVMPSKTAILPVNPTFLPRSEDEREMCARTIYCTDIDKQISQTDVQNFFETFCGEVSRLRILGDNFHSTRIAFVEFVEAESAIIALNCSGFVLGSSPIRVSPSKTPLRQTIPSYAPEETMVQ